MQTASDGAEGQLEEIIVTAERRTSDIQKAATSVSVRSGESLLEQGKYSLEEILEDVPSVGQAVGGPIPRQFRRQRHSRHQR